MGFDFSGFNVHLVLKVLKEKKEGLEKIWLLFFLAGFSKPRWTLSKSVLPRFILTVSHPDKFFVLILHSEEGCWDIDLPFLFHQQDITLKYFILEQEER